MKKTKPYTKFIYKMKGNRNLNFTVNFIIGCIIILSCSAKSESTRLNKNLSTVNDILKCAKNEEKCYIGKYIYKKRAGIDEENIENNSKLLSCIVKKYERNDVQIEYDTTDAIVKYTNIIVPFKNKGDVASVVAKAVFSFDYTGVHLPDSIVSSYYIEVYGTSRTVDTSISTVDIEDRRNIDGK